VRAGKAGYVHRWCGDTDSASPDNNDRSRQAHTSSLPSTTAVCQGRSLTGLHPGTVIEAGNELAPLPRPAHCGTQGNTLGPTRPGSAAHDVGDSRAGAERSRPHGQVACAVARPTTALRMARSATSLRLRCQLVYSRAAERHDSGRRGVRTSLPARC
jgi:hypothetical protein